MTYRCELHKRLAIGESGTYTVYVAASRRELQSVVATDYLDHLKKVRREELGIELVAALERAANGKPVTVKFWSNDAKGFFKDEDEDIEYIRHMYTVQVSPIPGVDYR